jgi:hypothetical protein
MILLVRNSEDSDRKAKGYNRGIAVENSRQK